MIDELKQVLFKSTTMTELYWIRPVGSGSDPTMPNPTIFVYGTEVKAEAAHRRWPMMHRCTGAGMTRH